MRKIAIVGSGGAGKSTLARRLGEITGVEVFHLDRLFWRPGWIPISKDELAVSVQKIVCTDSWIIDGNYSGTMELRFQAADTIIFLDFPLWTCLWGIFKRRLMYAGRTRPCMTEGCDEKLDLEFILWVLTFPFKRRKGIIEKLHKHSHGKDVFILKSRKAVCKFIVNIEVENG
ncbi:MAG TPA: DNA topology modulation protein [Clostridia bacterium]|nr:DNA topology modulation protein [Clostridia bacterium]